MAEKAHDPNTAICSLLFSKDGRTMFSRSMDDTLKVWDFRSFSKPVKVFGGLVNFFPQTDVIFSPDEKYVLTGSHVKKDQGSGKIIVLNRTTLEVVSEVDMGNSNAIRLLWHPKINQVTKLCLIELICQIIVGTATGEVKIFFDPKKSEKGALMSIAKGSAKANLEAAVNPAFISDVVLPDEEDMYDIPSRKRERDSGRFDPVRSHKPDLPSRRGPAIVNGAVGTMTSSLTKHLMQDLQVDNTRSMFSQDFIMVTQLVEDPREALLKYAKKAEGKLN